MQGHERPFVFARWVESSGVQIEGLRTSVEINQSEVALARSFYELANGEVTVDSIATELQIDIEGAVDFYTQLEIAGLCHDSMALAMFGHQASSSPDPFRTVVSDEEVARLSEIDADPAGELHLLDELIDPVDVKRRSVRSFSSQPISHAALSATLISSYGVVGYVGKSTRRPAPSGGAMYPLRHHVITRNVEGLASGHWVMALHTNALIRVSERVDEVELAKIFSEQWDTCAVIHVIGFDLTRSVQKYGSLAYRMALLEAGHAAQNAMRKATQCGVASWEIAGYQDERLAKLCGFTALHAGVATVILYGAYPN